jgi:diguanylate cyclase (GGDEF)-like protein
MGLVGAARVRVPRSSLPILSLSRGMVTYLLLVDAVALIWSAAAVARATTDSRGWWVLALLVCLALGFEEGATRLARLQFRLGSELKRDMTSVWTVAAAVALPPAQAVLLVTVVFTFGWWRQGGPAGQPVHRAWFTASSQLLGCLTVGFVLHTWSDTWAHLPWALAGAVSVFLAIILQSLINRALITGALLGVGVRGREILGTRDENLVELATLCLGGLVALAALQEPWTCVLVIAPMVALQRGAWVRELETAATIDSKTGLLNAIAWEHVANRELARAHREESSLAVLIIDIDRFKLVNDRYGHLVGDAVLKSVGRCLSTEVREYDSVGRFGGEEFVAVLPTAGDADALVVAERLRARVHALRVSDLVDDVEPRADDAIAVSIGVACMPADGSELSDLLHSADSALYRAKAAGRNRVMLAERGTGPAYDRVGQA